VSAKGGGAPPIGAQPSNYYEQTRSAGFTTRANREPSDRHGRRGLTKGGAAGVIVIRMSHVTHPNTPGWMRWFLAELPFCLIALATLAVLILLAAIVLGFVPIAETS
jgi:hypothetical protein